MELLYKFSSKTKKVDHVDEKQECELTNFRKGKAMEEFLEAEPLTTYPCLSACLSARPKFLTWTLDPLTGYLGHFAHCLADWLAG